MVEKKTNYLSLYFTINDVDFIQLKRFILDNIPNVKTVKFQNKYANKNVIIEFLYDKRYN